MKKLILMVLLIGLVASSAYAFDLGGYVGPIELKFYDWTVGRAYTPSGTNTITWTADDTVRSGLTGDAQNLTDGVQASADGVEDSWGIMSLQSINAVNGPLLWYSSKNGEYINGEIYDYDDVLIAANSNYSGLVGTGVGQEGGILDLYLSNLDIVSTANPADRSTDPFNMHNGVKFARLNGVSGVIAGSSITRWEIVTSDLSNYVSGFSGAGWGYLRDDPTWGGNYDWALNGSDVYTTFSFGPSNRNLFDAKSSDPANATSTPEPASMVMLGMGLLGLATMRRKKVA